MEICISVAKHFVVNRMIWICIKCITWRSTKQLKLIYAFTIEPPMTNDQRLSHLHIFLCKILNKFPVWLERRLLYWFLEIFSEEFHYQNRSLIDLFCGYGKSTALVGFINSLFHFTFETMWCSVWHQNLFDNTIKSTVCHLIHVNDCNFSIFYTRNPNPPSKSDIQPSVFSIQSLWSFC